MLLLSDIKLLLSKIRGKVEDDVIKKINELIANGEDIIHKRNCEPPLNLSFKLNYRINLLFEKIHPRCRNTAVQSGQML